MSTPPKVSTRKRVPYKPTASGIEAATPIPKAQFVDDAAKREAAAESTDLALAANAIFSGGQNTVQLQSGQVVTIRPATMAQLPQIMTFFGGVLDGMDPSQLAQLIDSVVHAQRIAIAKGADPTQIDLRELTSEELVTKVFGHTSLLTSLLAATFTLLPEMVESFTDMTAAEFRGLGLDEGALVAGGVFMLNYHFFTHSLPPILRGFMKSLASKKGPTSPVQHVETKKSTS